MDRQAGSRNECFWWKVIFLEKIGQGVIHIMGLLWWEGISAKLEATVR
jgi:hypothetical protein